MPPRELSPEAPFRMFVIDEEGNSTEITCSPDVTEILNKATDPSSCGFAFEPIKITIPTNFGEELIAVLIGLKTKDYRRMKKLRHIAEHSKSGRIRVKAEKYARRIFMSGQ